MAPEAIVTAVVLAVACILLNREVHGPGLVLLGALLALSLMGILTPSEVLQGFANPATFTIGGLLTVAYAVRRTGALDSLMLGRLLVPKLKPWRFLGQVAGVSPRLADAMGRMMAMGLVLPPVLGDVGTAEHLVPRGLRYARRLGLSPSRLLLPMAYAATLGGGLTLLGAVTNLMVSGLLEAHGHAPLTMWTQTGAALPGVILCVLALIIAGPRLLTDRPDLLDDAHRRRREYLVELCLAGSAPQVGKTVAQAGLRRLPGLFLIGIDRGGRSITPVGPDEKLWGGDRLRFAGSVETIADLQSVPGLGAIPEEEAGAGGEAERLIEAVVSESSPLVGVTVRGAAFRSRYNAVVVAVHRHGTRLDGRLGDVSLRAGDTLLLQADEGFSHAFRASSDFFVVSEVEGSEATRGDKAPMATFLAMGMLLAIGTGLMSPLKAALVGGIGVVVSGCLTVGEGRRAVKPAILMIFAMGFAVAEAVDKTGLGAGVAQGIVTVVGASPLMCLAALMGLTVALSQGVHNVVAAALSFPVAMALSAAVGLPAEAAAVAVALGACFSFMSPRSYQTLRLVEGPGRYTWGDYLKLGIPLVLIASTSAVIAISWLWEVGP